MHRRPPILPLIVLILGLAGCATAPPVAETRQMLWDKWGNQPLDSLLLAWGPPMTETRLTDGKRLVSWSYTHIYNPNYYDETIYGCKTSFLAAPPKYLIENVSLDGSDYSCEQLANGRSGVSFASAPYPPVMFFGGYYSRW
ncbi:MAG: hypothetical protein AB7H77_01985 [Bdellovibrionales bacterium]